MSMCVSVYMVGDVWCVTCEGVCAGGERMGMPLLVTQRSNVQVQHNV